MSVGGDATVVRPGPTESDTKEVYQDKVVICFRRSDQPGEACESEKLL